MHAYKLYHYTRLNKTSGSKIYQIIDLVFADCVKLAILFSRRFMTSLALAGPLASSLYFVLYLTLWILIKDFLCQQLENLIFGFLLYHL